MQIDEIIETLIVAADFVLLAIDGKGNVITASPPVRTVFEKQEGDVEGNALVELVPTLNEIEIPDFEPIEPRGGMGLMGDEEVQTADSKLLEYLACYKQNVGKYEIQVLVGSEIRWIDLAVYKLLDSNDEVMFLSTINDITYRKEAEEEIKELNETLEMKVQMRTAELEGRSEQVKNIIMSCADELTQVNQTYQEMKEKQMDWAEGLETSLLAGVEGLSDEQQSQMKEVLQAEMVRSMNMYSEDQITDQKFMLTIISLNEIFGSASEDTENLKPGQLSGTNQDEVDDLLDSLGI